MKVNVGCGQFPMEGWHNIDLFPPADEVGDFRAMRFENLDEVAMIHVLEHFSWQITDDILTHLYGWLRPAGLITIEVPDMEVLMARGCEDPMWQAYVYGIQTSPGEFHAAGFTATSLRERVEDNGFMTLNMRQFLSEEEQRPGFPCVEIVAKKPLTGYSRSIKSE